MKKACIGLVAILAGVFLFTPFASATALPPDTPPSPTAYYYGDADGDTLLTTFDLGILNNIFNGQSYTFFTLQPDNPNDDWNTADIDSDNLLTTFDLGYYSQYFNGQTLDLPDKPWIIEGVNLNASYATTGVFFPFNANVSAYNGDRGRAGVAVVAEIIPVGSGSTTTGSLSGRDCAAADLTDVADPGAQCALAITITDWQTNMILGLTESGTYGLEVMADAPGTIAIQLSVSDNGLGIEAPTISTTISARIVAVPLVPHIWYVKADATGAHNGTSWVDAFTDIQTGLNAASSGDQVWVAEYHYDYSGSYMYSIELKPGVSLYGGFLGTETSLPERGNPFDHPTILDAKLEEGTGSIVMGASNSRIDGFTIMRGQAYVALLCGSLPEPYCRGGGMANYNVTNVVVANCTFLSNAALFDGSGMWNGYSTVQITNCVFEVDKDNTPGSIGDIYNTNSDVSISRCKFIGFRDSASVVANYSSLTVTNSLFYGNYGVIDEDSDGGASSATITNCTFSGNDNALIGHSFVIKDSIFWGNDSWNENPDPWFVGYPLIAGTWNAAPVFDSGAFQTTLIDTTRSWVPSSLKGLYINPDITQGKEYTIVDNTSTTITVWTDVTGIAQSGKNYRIFDFHLSAASPDIDAGASAGAPADDLDGHPRPYPAGGAFDMGAYEWLTFGWSTVPIANGCASGAICGPIVNGVLTHPNVGQTLTCMAGSNSCAGVLFTYSGTGAQPLNCNLTINATAAPDQTCNLRLAGTDNGSPAFTVGQTIVVTIGSNAPPAWTTIPIATMCASGTTCGPTANGVATDTDAIETLTCSATSTSCSGVVFIYTGSSPEPVTCNLTVNATAAAPQNCDLRVQVADNAVGALTVGQTIAITIPNSAPTWSTTPGPITAMIGQVYSAVDGIANDGSIGQTLSCSPGGTDCAFGINVTGSGGNPQNCTVGFTAPGAATTCNLRIVAADNYSPALSVGQTVIITITTNLPPTWLTTPTNVTIMSSSVYSTVNGVLTDPDIGQTLTCSTNSTSCVGFSPTYTGSGTSPINCTLAFTAGATQNCYIRLMGTDNSTPAASVGTTITITVNGANEWTWMSGSNVRYQYGIYGTKGVPDPANIPGTRFAAVPLTDASGNFWLFGGEGYDASGANGTLNDLWRWDGANWTWMSGSDVRSQYGIYGTKGVPDPANVPGARYGAVSWTDATGNLWLFGGNGYPTSGGYGYLNDLWRWDGANWAWMSGSNFKNLLGVYGTKGVPDPANIPGTRNGAISWIDATGNLWLFGGDGYPARGGYGYLNDLWRWDGANWTWMSGSNAINQNGVYGTKGVPNLANVPRGRFSAVSMTDVLGNFWLFGGVGYAASGSAHYLNDLWIWDGANWTWMSGSNLMDQNGVYGTKGIPGPTNVPGARERAILWTDATGNLWLFGGVGIAASESNMLNDLWIYDF